MFQKFMKMMNKKNKGFTLVELMVVVIIIGILVAIAIPVYNSVTASAQAKACQANQRIIDGAVTQWAVEQTTPPAVGDSIASTVLASYLEDGWPTCPSTGTDYATTQTYGTPAVCPTGIASHAR